MSENTTNDPNEPGFDPLLPVVLKNGFKPHPEDKKLISQRIADNKKLKFLIVFAQCCNVQEACRQVGWSHSMPYRHRKDDPDFAAAWKEAEVIAVGNVKATAFDMAINGSEEDVYHMGEVVGTKVRRHESMVQFLLKKLEPETYGDKIDHSHTVDAGVLIVPGMAKPEAWEAEVAEQQSEHRSSKGPVIEGEAKRK